MHNFLGFWFTRINCYTSLTSTTNVFFLTLFQHWALSLIFISVNLLGKILHFVVLLPFSGWFLGRIFFSHSYGPYAFLLGYRTIVSKCRSAPTSRSMSAPNFWALHDLILTYLFKSAPSHTDHSLQWFHASYVVLAL